MYSLLIHLMLKYNNFIIIYYRFKNSHLKILFVFYIPEYRNLYEKVILLNIYNRLGKFRKS